MTRVIVVDDQPLVRQGIVLLLQASPDIEVIAQGGDGQQAVTLTEQLAPDVVVMDLRMPVLDGVEATRQITADRPSSGHTVKVLALTTFNEDEYVYGALRAGASGFVLKQAAPEELVEAVLRIATGEAWVDPRVAATVIAALASAPRAGTAGRALSSLTAREREVLMLMAEGNSNEEIARVLVLSIATVKTHVARILMKTGCRDRAQAVALAYQSGLVTVSTGRPPQASADT